MNDRTDGRVIRMDRRTRTTITVYMSVITGLMIFLAALSLTGVVHNPNPPSTIAGFAIVTIAGYSVLMFILARSRVALYPDGIEVTRLLWPSRRVARADITARRVNPSGWRRPPYHILITQDGREVKLPPYLEHSAALQSWLADIPLASRMRLKGGPRPVDS